MDMSPVRVISVRAIRKIINDNGLRMNITFVEDINNLVIKKVMDTICKKKQDGFIKTISSKDL